MTRRNEIVEEMLEDITMPADASIVDAIEEWLKRNGYDGLFCPEGECACELGDLIPCGCVEDCYLCEAGYKIPDEECEWCMSRNKKKAEVGDEDKQATTKG